MISTVDGGTGAAEPHRVRRWVFLLVVMAVEAFYLFYCPPYVYPDELSHLQAAVFYRSERRLPDPYSERTPEGRPAKIQQDKHPPYTYVVGALVLAASDGMFAAAAPIRLPGPYELSLDPAHQVTDAEAPQRGGVRDGQLYLLRLVMALHWLLAAACLLALADLLWPDRPRYAFSLALVTAAVPQAALGGASFTPDTPTSAFCIAAFYWLVRAAVRDEPALRTGLGAGLCLALALLAKSAAVFLLPVALLVALWRGRQGWRYLAWLLLPIALLAGWWYARNAILYGDPFQMRAQIEAYTHSIRREPLTSTFFEAMLWDLFHTFFGFADRQTLLPRPAYFLLAGLLGAAGIGLLLLVRRGVRAEASRAELTAAGLAIVGGLVLLLLTIAGNVTVPSAQGRYLFPALGCFLAATGVGFKIAARLRADSRWSLVAALVWVVFGIWAFHWAVLRREAPARARAHGEGGVLWYDDCGTPGLQPHKVQGHDAPDEGQLGRVVAWRTLNGHETAVVYRFPVPEGWRGDLQVRVVYFNPDPTTPFVAHAQGRFVYAAQRLHADGHLLHETIEVTSTPRELVYPLPARLLADGEVELRFDRMAGLAAVVSEIWIERPWIVVTRESGALRLENRTRRRLPCLLLHAKGGRSDHVSLDLGPGSVAAPPAVADADRLEVQLRELSPWMVREAEAHPGSGDGVRWLGDMDASGGYRMVGRGLQASLPFAETAPGEPLLILARLRRGTAAWELVEMPALDAARRFAFTADDARTSLDCVLLCGVWFR